MPGQRTRSIVRSTEGCLRAKKRSLPQLGTLGEGNHYIEIHVVDEILSESVAKKMSISHKRQMGVTIKRRGPSNASLLTIPSLQLITNSLDNQCSLVAPWEPSQAKSRHSLDFQDVLDKLADVGIAIQIASPRLVIEEAPEFSTSVTDVVNTCHDPRVNKKAINLRPIAVIKG
ncbi:hypothetical protein Celaphus_00019100 [Cervus elaphus hippelaphus]|uniref:3'-phosphate/5'-hydroxy nucleic acid ligase n=1 Tax=Cervus elaphus hippelaphus TaxID=46360 RepID=A0A212C7B5_CEREH|nr:hypothetical protein Celaphus_00019100 [Cervus elaphus hippelaphus]